MAQVPSRGEPGSPGELNFPYLFQLLEDEGYKDFVGCEYQPQGEWQVQAPGLALGKGVLQGQVLDRGCFPSHGLSHCLPLTSGDTVEGLSWLRSYWDRRGNP